MFPLWQDKSNMEIRLHSKYLVRNQNTFSAKAPLPGQLIALNLRALACSWTGVTGDIGAALAYTVD